MLGKHNFRLNQRVCRVEWRAGQPFMRVAKVTYAGARSIRVDGEATSSEPWYVTPDVAFEEAYFRVLLGWYHFQHCDITSDTRRTTRKIIELRRLENHLVRNRRKKERACLKLRS